MNLVLFRGEIPPCVRNDRGEPLGKHHSQYWESTLPRAGKASFPVLGKHRSSNSGYMTVNGHSNTLHDYFNYYLYQAFSPPPRGGPFSPTLRFAPHWAEFIRPFRAVFQWLIVNCYAGYMVRCVPGIPSSLRFSPLRRRGDRGMSISTPSRANTTKQTTQQINISTPQRRQGIQGLKA